MGVVGEAWGSPVTSALIVLQLYIWAKSFHGEIDIKDLAVMYEECYFKGHWWRLLTAPFCHSSFFQVVISVSVLWSSRHAEVVFGSMFFFRYSVLLCVLNGLLSLGIIHSISYWMSSPHLHSSKLSGYFGVTFSWLIFVFARGVFIPKLMERLGLFSFFGIVSLSWPIAPVALLLFSSFALPREAVLSNLAGMTCGYALAFGLIEVMPDAYWTMCVFIDMALVIGVFSTSATNSPRRFVEPGIEPVLEVLSLHNIDTEGVHHSAGQMEEGRSPRDRMAAGTPLVDANGEEVKAGDESDGVWLASRRLPTESI